MFETSRYDYELPLELIAQSPVQPRDASRLMVLERANQTIRHLHFRDLTRLLDDRDVIVVNRSQVIRARLQGHRMLDSGGEGGRVEFLLLEKVEDRVWEGMLRSAAKQVPGLKFRIPISGQDAIEGELLRGASESITGTVIARFDRDPVKAGAGIMPLPPYIERSEAKKEDESTYQTVYAKEEGSSAAPTAGLHFTNELIESLRSKGVGWEEVLLHVGLGTFRPVREEDLRNHSIHEERYVLSESTASALTRAKSDKKRIVAVGTTSLRTLESAWRNSEGRFQPGAARTKLFIYPGGPNPVQGVDRLITNFHLPKSTLLMLVCAFAGTEFALKAYQEAVRERYRFFSYGDAMLIL